jgi:hypothetical protein
MNYLTRLATCCGFCLLAGCGEGNGLVVTNGQVTMDGVPIAGAAVTFHPTSEEGSQAYAETGADGRFSLFTGAVKGVGPGLYNVTVRKTASSTDGSAATGARGPQRDGPGPKASGSRPTVFGPKPGEPSVRFDVLPVVYKDPQSTPLQVQIPAAGNQVEITLNSK